MKQNYFPSEKIKFKNDFFRKKNQFWTKFENPLKKQEMKVVISKSGLAVSVHKNANISGTIQDMKIPKLALCRGKLGLSCHKKIQVNTMSC